MDAGLIWQMAGFLVVAGAVYGGIRNDLRNIHREIERHDRAIARVHERLDDCGVCDRRKNAN